MYNLLNYYIILSRPRRWTINAEILKIKTQNSVRLKKRIASIMYTVALISSYYWRISKNENYNQVISKRIVNKKPKCCWNSRSYCSLVHRPTFLLYDERYSFRPCLE